MVTVILRLFIPVLPLLILLLSTTVFSIDSSAPPSPASSTFNRTCPGNAPVQYPFGFSPDSPIRLNCSDSGAIKVGDFEVQNVTADSILINFPPNCRRTIDDLSQLQGEHFQMTWRNGLLVDNCSVPLNGCALPMHLLTAGLHTNSCTPGAPNNISCYSDAYFNNSLFLNYDDMKKKKINCKVAFSSITVGLDRSFESLESFANRSTSLMLNFQTLELGWWLHGNCSCHKFATCNTFLLPTGGPGYRCKCKQGYVGDGFVNSTTGYANSTTGCKLVSHCNSSTHIFGRCGGRKVGVLLGGIMAGACLMVALVLFYYCIRIRTKSLKNRMRAKRLSLLSEAAGSSSIPFYTYKDIERATSYFADDHRLGTGAYGTVYSGKLRDDEWVAIKKIKNHDHESIEQVMNEIKLVSSVSHPNLVRLLGCCIENGEQILVYEFMPNGTLSQHLQRERGSGLPWTIRLTIATETANAIAHLHSAINPPIYHRDIKSSNILLDVNYRSKVADFGLSRFGMMDDSHVSTAPQGTPGYVDPQYHQNFHLSDKSDVYSFGVVLTEIITAMKVVDFSRPHSEINLAALVIDRIGKGLLDEIIDPFLDPHRDAWTFSSIHKVGELAFRCLAFHGDMRPSMMEVADELEQIRLSGWAPLEENICMASSAASSCSSPFDGSEKSFNSRTTKKSGVGSRRLVVSQKGGDRELLSTMEESKDSSPVSVQDPWFSEQSSPSTNSLLNNVVQ